MAGLLDKHVARARMADLLREEAQLAQVADEARERWIAAREAASVGSGPVAANWADECEIRLLDVLREVRLLADAVQEQEETLTRLGLN